MVGTTFKNNPFRLSSHHQRARWVEAVLTILYLGWTCLLITPAYSTNCSLPQSWEGKWFIQEFSNDLVIINSSSNSISRFTSHDDSLGDCMLSDEAYYIFFNAKSDCWKCVLFTESHKNVMQSREGDCIDKPDLNGEDPPNVSTLCESLQESEQHFYWFRDDYKPTTCPFSHMSFTFSYRKSDWNTKCTTPVSHSSACINDTKMKVQYQACHDVAGSVSKSEQLTCVGDWEESQYRYFVADSTDFHNNGRQSNRNGFRCYIYKQISTPNPTLGKPDIILGYDVGTLDSSTCSGLHNPEEAETTLYFRRDNDTITNSEKSCSFPTWLASHNWTDMATTAKIVVHPLLKNRIMHIKPMQHYGEYDNERKSFTQKLTFFPLSPSKLVCVDKASISEDNDVHVAIIGKYTVGCTIDEICLHLIQRSDYVFQIYYLERGDMSLQTLREKCFNATISELQSGATMLSTKGHKKACPHKGKYNVQQHSQSETEKLDGSDLSVFTASSEWLFGCANDTEVKVLPTPNSISNEHMTCVYVWDDLSVHTKFTIIELNKVPETRLLPRRLYCMKSVLPGNQNFAQLSQPTVVTTRDCIHVDVDQKSAKEGNDDGDSNNEESINSEYYVELMLQGPCHPTGELNKSVEDKTGTNEVIKHDGEVSNPNLLSSTGYKPLISKLSATIAPLITTLLLR